MSETVSDFVWKRLSQWGVHTVYGYPGDGINGLLGALNRRGDGDEEKIRFIQARHEEMAAFMACGHAKLTGQLGVCLATSGPGAIHLLNGLYDAKMDRQPVLAIVGQSARNALGGDYQQEVDLPTLFKDVAHEYVQTAMSPQQVRHLIDRAIRIAVSERTVTCIIFPKDVQELDYEGPAHAHDTVHTGVGYSAPRVIASDAELDRAAGVLNAGKKVAMLVGAGALYASEEVLATADILQAGIAKALLGRAAIRDDLPFVTGAIGLLGTKPSSDMMADCDTLLVVGSSFPYAEFYPKEGQARGVQIDIDPRMIGIRYPMEVNLVGDAALTLRMLAKRLQRKTSTGWRESIEKGVTEWRKLMEERAMVAANPINPQRVFWELSKQLPEDCIVVADSGSSADWFARDLEMKPGMSATLSGALATMGCGVPYAIAAKFAHPKRVAIACVGDGAMQMNGMAELLTVVRYWREWVDPRLVVMVLNNGDLNQVTWEMRAMEGDKRFAASQDLPPMNYAAFADLIGLKGIRVETPEQIKPAWEAAFHADRPTVIDVVVDPDVPPLPPHITLAQCKNFMMSVMRNDAHSAGFIKQAIGNMFPSIGEKS